MGDTFPHSLETLDLRLRTAGKYSAFLQELGRMCRYPATRPIFFDAFGELNLGSTGLKQLPSQFTVEQGNDLDEKAKEFIRSCAQAPSVRGPGKPYELPVLLRQRDGVVGGVACNDAQLDLLVKKHQAAFTLEIYQDRVPYSLVKKNLHARLIEAVNFKQRRAPHNDNITIAECILMKEALDAYMKCATGDQEGEKKLREKIEATGINPLHNYLDYHKPDVRQGKDGTQKSHYDAVLPKPAIHPRRFLLFAECQIGKTGCYLHLLSALREEVQGSQHQIEDYVPTASKQSWHLPYWKDLETVGGLNKLDYT